MMKSIYKHLRTIIRNSIIKSARFILRFGWLSKVIKKVLLRFPGLFYRLERIVNSPGTNLKSTSGLFSEKKYKMLSPATKKIHQLLLYELKKRKRSG